MTERYDTDNPRRIDADEYESSPSTGWRATYAIMVGEGRDDP